MNKRLIFTVTTGRSGTDYLSRLLACVPGVESVHESPPNYEWAMRDALADPEVARRFWVEQKLPTIESSTASIYSETSHVVCKGFLEPLLDLGVVPDLVLLRRKHRDVAMSFYRLQTIPGRSFKGLRWCVSPDDPGVLALPGWQRLHDYQLCYWYCLETERRRRHYGEMFRRLGARVVDIDLVELATRKGFRRLRRELELPSLVNPYNWYRFLKATQVRANTKSGSKKDADLPDSPDVLERQVDALVESASLTRSVVNKDAGADLKAVEACRS